MLTGKAIAPCWKVEGDGEPSISVLIQMMGKKNHLSHLILQNLEFYVGSHDY